MEPLENDYSVILNAKGANLPNSTLRTNKFENAILAFLGDNRISVKYLPKDMPKGVKETKIVIKSTFGEKTNVTVENFACFDRDKVVVLNNYGLIEIFQFSLKSDNFRKLCDLDMNLKSGDYLEFPVGLSVKEKNGVVKFAVSTLYDDDSGEIRQEEILRSLKIFEFKENEIIKICEKEFELSEKRVSSSYYYIDFNYEYKGKEILFGFQNEEERNLDIYCVENNKIELVHREKSYHSDYFTAIRRFGDEGIVSVDYSGEMKILKLDEIK